MAVLLYGSSKAVGNVAGVAAGLERDARHTLANTLCKRIALCISLSLVCPVPANPPLDVT